MKRKFLCLLLAVLMLSSSLSANAVSLDTTLNNRTDISPYATKSFSMKVSANSLAAADSAFSLAAGETVTIKASYTPFSASVDFGIIAPDGLFYGANTTTGSFDRTFQVSQSGQYTMAVRNNSNYTVSVSGYVNY